MARTSFWRWLLPTSQNRPTRQRQSTRSAWFRPRLQQFEDRLAPAVVNWIAGSGDWGTPSNWSTNVVPGVGDDAVISTAGITVTHSSGSDAVQSVQSAASFVLSGGVLAVAGNVSGTGTFSISGGSTLGSATVNLNVNATGTSTLDGVTLNGNLNLAVAGTRITVRNGLTLNGAATIASNASSIDFNGTQTLGGAGSIAISRATSGVRVTAAGATLTIGPNVTIKGTVGAVGFQGSGPTNIHVVNQGTVGGDAAGTGLTLNAATWTNSGTIQARNGGTTSIIAPTWSNPGTFLVDNGTLNLGSTFTPAEVVGHLNRTGGTVNITGTLNNVGTTLPVDVAAGPFNVAPGGRIDGGSIVATLPNGVPAPGGLVLTASGGTLNGIAIFGDFNVTDGSHVTVTNGLTLNGSSSLTGLGCSLDFAGTQTLGGTATITSDGGTIYLPTSGTTLTIGPNVTVAGPHGEIVGEPGTAVVNQGTVGCEGTAGQYRLAVPSWTNVGTIQALAGGTTSIESPSWTNPGTLRLSAGTLNLGGTFTPAHVLGHLDRTGGTLKITGRLNNIGTTLPMDTVTGSWTLAPGGTIDQGTVTATGGVGLLVTGGTLNGVTLDANLDFTEPGDDVVVTNGLTLNGTATLGYTRSSLSFAGTQTLGGTGRVAFGSFIAEPNIRQSAAGGTLTIGPDMTITGHRGTVGYMSYFGGPTNVSVVNYGTISTDVADGSLLRLTGQNWTNYGTIQATNGGEVIVQPTTLTNLSAGTLTGGVWKALGGGTLRMMGANIVTDAATIVLDGVGARIVNDAGSTNALAGLVAVAPTGSFTLQNGATLTTAVSPLTNQGTVTVGNNSTLTVNGAGYRQTAGTTTLIGGTITTGAPLDLQGGVLMGVGTVNGGVTNAGRVVPGLPLGTLTVNGAYTQTATGVLDFDIGGTTASPVLDLLAVSGSASLDGTVNVANINGFTPEPGQTLTPFTYANRAGDFATINLPLDNGVPVYVPEYRPTSFVLYVPLPTVTTLTTDPQTGSVYGESVVVTATVSANGATPTGSVQFVVDGTNFGAPVALSGGIASFTTATLPAGQHSFTAVYASNYAFYRNSATASPTPFTVAQAPLTVTADDATKIYGAANPSFSATYAGFVLGEGPGVLGGSLSFTTPATSASHVGSYTISPTGLTAANYAITFVDGTLTVTPAPLTIAADDKSKVYGAALPIPTASYSGFVNGDTSASLATAPTLSTTATAASHVGTYVITASGAASADYTIDYVTGTLSVTPAVLTVTADNVTRLYGQANPTLTATISGFVNGDTSAVVNGTAHLSTTATASSPVNVYVITADAGTLSAADYTFAMVNGLLTVDKAHLTVAADDKTKVYGAPVPTLTFTMTGFVNGETLATSGVTGDAALNTTATAASPVGTYPITVALGSLSADNYDFVAFNPGTLTVTNQPPTASAGGPYALAEGGSLQLDASASSDPDGHTLTYSWDVNGDGTFGDATGVSPMLTWAQLNALGLNDGPHTSGVRVRVSDGIDTVTSSAATLSIANAPPTVAVSGPATGDAGQALNFTFAASDPSPLDQAGTFTYRIDWDGDGSVDQTVTGPSSVVVGHTFADEDSFDIIARASDRDEAEGPTGVWTVDIGDNDCGGTPGTAVLAANGDLIVTGTNANDRIDIRPGLCPGTVRVRMNHHNLGTFALSPTATIHVCGLAGNDQVRVSVCVHNATVVHGGAGNDRIWGGGGTDELFGDEGCDRLYARGGTDQLFGGDGDDEVWGGCGGDTLDGGAGNDDLYGGTGGDVFQGGAGNDRLWGGAGCDVLQGGAGNDTLRGGGGRDQLDGGLGDDHLIAGAGGDTLLGGDGADTLKGGAGDDWLDGMAGNDRLDGMAGNDVMLGGAGDDLLLGGADRDVQIGGLGADRIEGNSDEDILIAGYTLFDGNAMALNAIRAEWTSCNSYAVRVANITGGTGATQGFRLWADEGALKSVFDDNAHDVLCGGAGIDWFFANVNGSGVLDTISDLRANELWTDTDF